MTNPPPPTPQTADDASEQDDDAPVCVMVFNANDPSGAGGLAADIAAIASVGGHGLPVVTGAYARDSGEVFDHFAFDEEAVAEQAPADAEQAQNAAQPAAVQVKPLRAGIIGLDTSHAIAFTEALNNPDAPTEIAGCKVVAAYPQGSPDIESSVVRVPGYIGSAGR